MGPDQSAGTIPRLWYTLFDQIRPKAGHLRYEREMRQGDTSCRKSKFRFGRSKQVVVLRLVMAHSTLDFFSPFGAIFDLCWSCVNVDISWSSSWKEKKKDFSSRKKEEWNFSFRAERSPIRREQAT